MTSSSRLAGLLVCLAVAATGCGGDGGGPTSSSPTSSPSTSVLTPASLPGGPLGPAAAAAALGVDAGFAVTQTIVVTTGGFVPADAVSVAGCGLAFLNRTGRPVTVAFDNAEVPGSPELAPDQAWTYIPKLPSSISFRAGDASGTVLVEAFYEPGEYEGLVQRAKRDGAPPPPAPGATPCPPTAR